MARVLDEVQGGVQTHFWNQAEEEGEQVDVAQEGGVHLAGEERLVHPGLVIEEGLLQLGVDSTLYSQHLLGFLAHINVHEHLRQ